MSQAQQQIEVEVLQPNNNVVVPISAMNDTEQPKWMQQQANTADEVPEEVKEMVPQFTAFHQTMVNWQKCAVFFIFLQFVFILFIEEGTLSALLTLVAIVCGICDEVSWLVAIVKGKRATYDQYQFEKLESQPFYVKVSQFFNIVASILEIGNFLLEPNGERLISLIIMILLFIYLTYTRINSFLRPCAQLVKNIQIMNEKYPNLSLKKILLDYSNQ